MSKKKATKTPPSQEDAIRAAATGQLVACRINADWRQRGQAVMLVLRRSGARRYAAASFLVDLWCAGLKDAWGKLDISQAEFDQMALQMDERMERTMHEAELAEIAAVVAGGIRFARQNGFRLPGETDWWAAFVGPLRVDDADLAAFGVDGGKLRWIGPRWDLEARQERQTVEEFAARADVEALFDVYDDDDDGEEDEDLAEEWLADPIARQMMAAQVEKIIPRATDAIRRWCFAQAIRPADRLKEAVTFLMRQMVELPLPAGLESGDWDDAFMQQASQQAMDRVIAQIAPQDRPKMELAIEQVMQFVQQFKSHEEALAALGFDQSEE